MNQNLTTSASFKRWVNLPATTVLDDTLVTELIADASTQIISYLDRQSLFKNTLTEYYDGTGGPKIQLREWPVLAVNSVYDSGNLLKAATQPNPGIFLDPWNGFLPGKMQSLNFIGGSTQGGNARFAGAFFSRGIKNIAINYTFGYAISGETWTIPSAAPYQITAAQQQGSWGQDDGLTIDGVAGVAVNGIPAAGQYSVVNGLYTFAAADAGKSLVLNYSYIPSVVQSACNMVVSEMYTYRTHIGQKTHTVGGNVATSFDNTILTTAVMTKLQPYKRMVPW